MNKELKIKEIFNSISDHKDFKKAIDLIAKFNDDSDEIFRILWTKAIQRQSIGEHVYVPALTLYKLNITCPISAQESIEQVCVDWDISIEEIPWYLANQFSKEVVLELTQKLNFETKNQKH